MRRELARPLAYAGLGAAALFAVGSIAAVAIVSEQRSSAVEEQRPEADLQRRADAARATIAAHEAEALAETCAAAARIVPAVALQERATTAIETASAVTDARLVLRLADREAFEVARQAAAAAFATGFLTDEDAELAETYAGEDDVEAACLARAASTPAPEGELDADAVEALEAQAASLGEAEPIDLARVDMLNQNVTAFAAPTLATIDAMVGAGGIDETRAALDGAAEALRAETTTDTALDALEALTAHAQAAVDRQAALDAQAQQPVEQQPVQQAPARPVQPAPVQPAPEPEPAPTQPEEPGGGDSPVDPLVP